VGSARVAASPDASPAGHCPDDDEWLGPGHYRVRKRSIGWFVRQVLLAGEEPDEWAAPLRRTVTQRPPQYRIPSLEGVEDQALGGHALDVELNLATYARQLLQVSGENNAYHGNVWTSTDSTAGRSRTIGAQLSPASADA